MGRLYDLLQERGDNFFHWMACMYRIGQADSYPTLSGLDNSAYDASPVVRP
jgi:hypothetical protein